MRAIFVVVVIAGCRDSAPPDLGHLPDVSETLASLPAPLQQRFATPLGRAELQQALAQRQALVDKARGLGVHERSDIKAQVRAFEDRLIVRTLLDDQAKKTVVTEAELQAYFAAHRAAFEPQPSRVVARILFSHARGHDAAARADAAKKRLDAGEPFAVVAAQGDGPERIAGGQLGPISPNGPPEGKNSSTHEDAALARAVFAAPLDQVTTPIALPSGMAILRVSDVPQAPVTFDMVRAQVQQQFQATAQRRALDALLAVDASASATAGGNP